VKTACAYILAGLLLAGCVTTATMDTPSGFARYVGSADYRLISPEGIVFRARVEANKPRQSLAFWAEALSNHLSDSGYALLDDSNFDTTIGDGRWFEWLAPVGAEDWIYLTAIVVTDSNIVVVESAGPNDRYREYRGAILDEINSIALRRSLR